MKTEKEVQDKIKAFEEELDTQRVELNYYKEKQDDSFYDTITNLEWCVEITLAQILELKWAIG